jgi:hypothetical protein
MVDQQGSNQAWCVLFIQSMLQASVEEAVAANPSRFVVADVKWTGGTEQMLDAVQQFMSSVVKEGTSGAEGSAEQKDCLLV